ncbi:radial spokehead-like protein [Kipferlia bialata]|uniref:Radial spoke head protein 9 homolog n=1 Tax=Kipferlia bialata TaxID=797122 RepID=A0A391NKF9_9EUKA|nr:radial spokehead-like protein [Kipferlia bialata]|eukprot:g4186.t1
MELDFLTYAQRLQGLGIPISPEQKAIIELALPVICNDRKFSRCQFWGRIRGVTADYWLIQGSGDKEKLYEHTLYSQDCVEWAELPSVDDEAKAVLTSAGVGPDSQIPFTGDAALVHRTPKAGEEEEDEEEAGPKATELQRLAMQVAHIDSRTQILPRDAYYLAARRKVSLSVIQ